MVWYEIKIRRRICPDPPPPIIGFHRIWADPPSPSKIRRSMWMVPYANCIWIIIIVDVKYVSSSPHFYLHLFQTKYLDILPDFIFWPRVNLTVFLFHHLAKTVRTKTRCTGWLLNNGPPNTKVIFSCNKRLNLTTKFGVLGFLGIVNLQQKVGDSSSKIVDFFLMSNFC